MTDTSMAWAGRSVFITGHTGFKGGWLTVWLHQLGARIHGYALDPLTTPSMFEVARVGSLLESDHRADVADLARLTAAMRAAMPSVVFHLAAQPLVRTSYVDPVATFTTNVIGTVNVLEAARGIDGLRAIVVITTDKVYENRESLDPYQESDRLGGDDPYSSSKAAAELATASYRSSFFSNEQGAQVASARSGNVIGGGDWATDRLLPDCLRAFDAGRPVRLRHPDSVRPWQHVLEPLSGYLSLAEQLWGAGGRRFASAWNFGPRARDAQTVAAVADEAARLWGDGATVEHRPDQDERHETGLLTLDIRKARKELSWTPRWSLGEALAHTISWHRAWGSGVNMLDVTRDQIRAYEAAGSR